MYPFWRSNFGKLFIGGCGLQIGLLLTLVSFVLVSSFCLIFVFAGVLGFSLAQPAAGLPTSTPVVVLPPESPASGEADRLLAEIDLLIGEIDSLQAETAATRLELARPAAVGTPVALANQEGVSLRSGPGPEYDQVGSLPPGQSLEVVGRNHTSAWWLVSMPNDRFAWIANTGVNVSGAIDGVPVVAVPSQLAQPAASGSLTTGPAPIPTITPTPTLPPGTPTPGADIERQYVEDTPSYQSIKWNLLVPPVSASFSPDGSRIALSEGVKLYTFQANGSYPEVWMEDDDKLRPVGGAVWSPDGQYIAFVAEFKPPDCFLCRSVALLRPADGEITFLEGPDDLQTDSPRWTQDGRILVNVHPGEPADGTTYIFNIFGEGQEATGVYTLSSSHDGQKWYPWRPGRTWRAGVTERPDSYYND